MIQVSVIIINYNSSAFTAACVRSLQNHTAADLDYEVIVVDNDSKLEDYRELRRLLPGNNRLRIIRSIQNLGFAGGNMLGLQAASGQYIYFLNNDCEVLNDNLGTLYRFMQATPDAGICTGQMHYADGRFHPSFTYFPTLALRFWGSSVLRPFAPAQYPLKNKVYDSPIAVPVATGAALFADREKLAQIGGFDTHYFLYCEEEDICQAMHRAGHPVYLVPGAKFLHHMGKSTVRNFRIELENYISLLYYHRKYDSYLSYLGLKTLYFFKNLKRGFRHRLYFKVAGHILRGAPMKYSLKYSQPLHFDEPVPLREPGT